MKRKAMLIAAVCVILSGCGSAAAESAAQQAVAETECQQHSLASQHYIDAANALMQQMTSEVNNGATRDQVQPDLDKADQLALASADEVINNPQCFDPAFIQQAVQARANITANR